jgi:hypothetical protein
MRRLLLAAALATAVPGCTIGGAVTGGLIVRHHNSDVPDDQPDDRWSAGTGVLVGLALGLAIDVLIIRALAIPWSRPMT